MNIVQPASIPENILQDSILARIAAAYFSVSRKLERKTRCSATRGFILSTLRDGAILNQNQIATLLGLDRTVVHRAIKTMRQEGLLAEKRSSRSGRAIPLHLTAKGEKYRAQLIRERRAADEKLLSQLTPDEHSTFIRLLNLVSLLEL
jgi:DNA-binding MarR family transcriptional regulator